MPISFEQPQPVAPGISSAYGAATVMQANNPLLLQQQQMRQHAYEQAAQLAAQQQQHAAQLAQQGAQHRDELGFRQQQLASEENRDAFHVQAQLAGQQQAADLHGWWQSQLMTRAEELELERKKAAAAEVMNHPTLSADEKSRMLLQIRTGIDPLVAKQKATQMQLQQAETQKLHDETARAATMEAENVKFRAMTTADRTKHVTLADGTVAAVIENGPGRAPTVITGGKGVSREEKQYEADVKHAEFLHDRWLKHHTQYEALVAGRMKSLREVPENFGKSEEDLRALAEKGVGMPRPGPEPVMPARPGSSKGAQPDATAATEKGGDAAGTVPAGGGDNRPKPEPKDATTIAEETRKQIAAKQLTPGFRAMANQMIDQVAAMIQAKGGYKNLSAEEKAVVDNNREQLRRILLAPDAPAPRPQQPQPQPPAPAAGSFAVPAPNTGRGGTGLFGF